MGLDRPRARPRWRQSREGCWQRRASAYKMFLRRAEGSSGYTKTVDILANRPACGKVAGDCRGERFGQVRQITTISNGAHMQQRSLIRFHFAAILVIAI